MRTIYKRETWDRFAHMWLIAISVALAAGVSSTPCVAQPATVAYQGELRKNGAPFGGKAEFKFAIVAAGQTLWSNDGSSANGSEPSGSVDVQVNDGAFSVLLGETPMVPLEAALLNTSSGAALRVWVNTGDGFEQLSDQPISSSVFSLHSESADSSPAVFAATGGVVAGTGTAALRGGDNPVTGSATLASDNDLVIGFRSFQGNNPLPIDPLTFPNHQVGIGTLAPTATLDIQGQVRIRGGNPGAGRVLTSDANGLASWQEVGLPPGAVILWTGASCPGGFTRLSALDGRFLVSGPAYDAAAGGSNTHGHGAGGYTAPSHTHSASSGTHTHAFRAVVSNAGGIDPAWSETNASSPGPGGTGTGGAGPVTGESAQADSRPEFATILLCQKD